MAALNYLVALAECSHGAVLTLEFSAGMRVDYYAREHPDAMPRLMNTLVSLMLQTIFENGLFHADPHPGNVFVLPDGRLSLLDFGNTGELDESMRESLMLLLEAVVTGDARAATEAYLEMAPASEVVNRGTLLRDIKVALYEIRRSNLADVSVGNAFDALLRAGSRNGVHNPRASSGSRTGRKNRKYMPSAITAGDRTRQIPCPRPVSAKL